MAGVTYKYKSNFMFQVMRDQAGLRGGRVRGVHGDGVQAGQGEGQAGPPQHQRLPRPRGQHAR